MAIVYEQLPPDLRKKEKIRSFLCWSVRGKVIKVQNEKEILRLRREGFIWRQVSSEELKAGIKAGSYNPVYDQGEQKRTEVKYIIDSPQVKDNSDYIEVIEI